MSGRSCLLIQVQLTQLMSLRWLRQSAKTHKGSSVSGKLRLTFMWTVWRSHVVESQYRVFREGSQGWEGECRNKCPVCCSNNGICCYWASSIHPSWIFFFYDGGVTPQTSRHLIKSQGHFLVLWKGTQVEKQQTKPLTNMDERCFHRLCGGVASYSCPPSFTKPAWCVCLSSMRAFCWEASTAILSLTDFTAQNHNNFLTTVCLPLGFYFLFVVSLSFSSLFPERCTRQMKEHRSQSDELV